MFLSLGSQIFYSVRIPPPPFYFVQSPYFYSVCVPPYLISLSFESTLFIFSSPLLFVSPNFQACSSPPYFRSFTLFWVDQIYIHSIKMTRLFLLRKYEAQAPESGDGGNRGRDTHIPKHLQLYSTMLATVLVVPHW